MEERWVGVVPLELGTPSLYIGGLSPITPRQYCAVITAAAIVIVKGFIISQCLSPGLLICNLHMRCFSSLAVPFPCQLLQLNEVPHTTIITLSDWWRVYSWL